ncbi:MAG: hypothetical protein A2X48_12175 [Lentisphaerae bacterium GWF2_49_21]|nr:MAG: hypothetical protein A2X48_12175 [Lentisphaerae bacterium GWF2_49_21]
MVSHTSISTEDGQAIPVEIIIKSIRSRYRISVSEKGVRLVLSRSSRSDAGKILEKHARWIRNHYAKMKDSVLEYRIADGSEIPFRGCKCLLKISSGENSIAFDSDRYTLEMQVSDPAPENLRSRLRLWYLSQSANFAKILSVRLDAVGKFDVRRIVLKDMSTRWGTCCRKRRIITLNWRLILAPDDIYEYVFYHELAHFKVPGHGREFWSWMDTILPGSSSRRSWLNKNGYALLHFLSEDRLSPERIL